MKRTVLICVLLALLIALLPAAAYAAGPGCFGRNYVDADSNGVCDNAMENSCSYADENSDGICDYRAMAARGCGRGRNGCGFRCGNVK